MGLAVMKGVNVGVDVGVVVGVDVGAGCTVTATVAVILGAGEGVTWIGSSSFFPPRATNITARATRLTIVSLVGFFLRAIHLTSYFL